MQTLKIALEDRVHLFLLVNHAFDMIGWKICVELRDNECTDVGRETRIDFDTDVMGGCTNNSTPK
jgi:hypothetical protein